MKTFSVTEPSLLLEFLYKHCSQLNRTRIRQTLKYGSVLVNGRVSTSHALPLKPGDTIEILSKKAASAEQFKSQAALRIVYEDEHLLVAEKPAGLLTMGSEKEKERTLYFMLTEYQRAKSKDGQGRVFIVHRLDRDSSGLVVFAKTEPVKVALQKDWELTVKKYYAITEGVPEKKTGTVKSELVEDPFKRVYSIAKPARGSKHAVTHYRVLNENGRYALLEVTLETGRKNQIRVHLSDIGHPIVGDSKYGARINPLRRVALHAFFLEFPHPVTEELKAFTSRLPGNFEKLLKQTEADRPWPIVKEKNNPAKI